MQNDGEGLPSIILAGQGLLNSENAHLMNHMVYFNHILHSNTF